MAVSTKYGNVDIPKIGVDEPVFILRAQDKAGWSNCQYISDISYFAW